MKTYEIRRSGQVICRSSIVNCGYLKETINDMEENGMHLYCDGKKVKSRPGRSRTGNGNAGVFPTLQE